PTALVTVKLAGAAGKAPEHVIKIGKPTPDAAGGERFAQIDSGPAVAVLPGALAQRLLADPISFRDRGLARFADADKAVLERGPRKATFAKVDGTWKLTEPVAADAEQTEMEDLINALARLRADELVADKPADLKPFGLDKPEARWRFLSGDKEVLSLLIGNRDKAGNRCYAKLATGDLVVLLDAGLTKKLLGEMRSRSVWPAPPDAAQVETVRYGYARDPFVLEKADNAWRVVGKPDVKVKQEAGSDTLA